jgi:hypothetical protein
MKGRGVPRPFSTMQHIGVKHRYVAFLTPSIMMGVLEQDADYMEE